jgi:hypothetical protein
MILERFRDDLRAKVYLGVAVVGFVSFPSAVLVSLGLPEWLVWPVFALLFLFVAMLWLMARYYEVFLSPWPDFFWPGQYLRKSKEAKAQTQVVEVTPELEHAIWSEWMDRIGRSGHGHVLVAILNLARPFVGRHVPRHSAHPEGRSAAPPS